MEAGLRSTATDRQQVLLSEYNSMADGRYFDTASQTSFQVDHASQVSNLLRGIELMWTVTSDTLQQASGAQSHPLESQHADTVRSLQKAFSTVSAEHFPSSTISITPFSSDSSIAILLIANKYSPSNFWNGRWRSTYVLSPSAGSLSGTIKVDVHYYEDGNVRMSTSKKVEVSSTSGAEAVVREIVKAENKFQEELNKAFTSMAEGSFKGLRRQLPVTRQRVDWEKIGGYRVSCCSAEAFQGHCVLNFANLLSSWAKTSVAADPNRFQRFLLVCRGDEEWRRVTEKWRFRACKLSAQPFIRGFVCLRLPCETKYKTYGTYP